MNIFLFCVYYCEEFYFYKINFFFCVCFWGILFCSFYLDIDFHGHLIDKNKDVLYLSLYFTLVKNKLDNKIKEAK